MKEETEKIQDLQSAISVNDIQKLHFFADGSLAVLALLAGSSSPSEKINTLRKTTKTMELDLYNPTQLHCYS
jgi:hypothetical protein